MIGFAAVGDDGTTGTASSYEVRYAAGTCGAFEFATGAAVPAPAPLPAGSHEVIAITGLGAGAPYCVGVQVIDEVGNRSAVATVAFTTPP